MLYLVQKSLVKHMMALGDKPSILTEQELKTLNIAFSKMSNLEMQKTNKPLFSQSLTALVHHLKLGSVL